MKRLIRKANAYDWVSERADHIRDKNDDMPEGMEYGIAWKQYKKENPKWKNKKEKSKKKASRLRRIAMNDDGECTSVEEVLQLNDEVGDYVDTDFVVDIGNRDCAFIYLDGKIYTGKTHEEIINSHGSEEDAATMNENGNATLEDLDLANYAFGSIVKGVAFVIDEFKGCTLEEVSKALNQQVGCKKVYKDNCFELERVANTRLLKKVAEFVYCDECHWDNGDFMWNNDGTMQEWAEKLEGTKKMKKLKEIQVYKSRKEFDEKNDGTCPECGAKDSLHLD